MPQKLLPDPSAISSLQKRTTFFYFFKLKNAKRNGAGIREQFAQHQSKCLHWLNCEYAFIGAGENTWTHAAIFEFPNFKAVEKAIETGISSEELEGIQGFAVQATRPPKLALFLFKLLRPIGALLHRGPEEATVDEVVEIIDTEGGIHPNRQQIARHLQNKRTAKAYMINLLQTYEQAQYPGKKSRISGATAYYRKYGFVAARSVYMLGGELVLAGRMGEPIIEANAPVLTKGVWEGIGIMEYPDPSNLIALEKMPGYKKSLTHRNAGLERTVLIISKKG